jgi:hypothetical protein
MIREVFEQRLASLSAREAAKATALVEEYRKDLADVHDTALLALRAGGNQAARALSVIAQLEETAVQSLIPAIEVQTPVPDTSLLVYLVNGIVFAETAVVGRLKALLADTHMVPQPPEMNALEEVAPPYRVCDEAYVGLRQVLNHESYLQFLVESRHFLALPDEVKNTEIESWLETGSFTRFLGDVDVPEEE